MDGETLFLLEMLLTLGVVIGLGAFELWRLRRSREDDSTGDK